MAPLPFHFMLGGSVEFSFGQVENALAHCQSIRDERRSAFANRLKNYQKAGFPEGINTGRGRAATYGIGHLILLGLALELNQLGLNPERAVAVIESDMHSVATAFYHVASGGPPQREFMTPFLLYFDPAALSELMLIREEDRAVGSFFYAGLGQFIENIKSWVPGGGLSRLAVINVAALLWDLASWISAQSDDLDPIGFYEQTKIWASPFIHNEPFRGRDPQA